MGLKLKLRKSGTKTKPSLKAFSESEDGLDEDVPFDSAEEITHIDPGVSAQLEKPVDPSTIPEIVVGSPDDPFGGRPRIYFDQRQFALVKQDKLNWTLHHYIKSFNKKLTEWTQGYRRVGYYSSLRSAIGHGLARSLEECAVSMEKHRELKDLMTVMRETKERLETILKDVTPDLFSSGDLTPSESS